jgi:hypothetical protein
MYAHKDRKTLNINYLVASGESNWRVFVSPAYGYIGSALVKCSNDGGPGPRYNRK